MKHPKQGTPARDSEALQPWPPSRSSWQRTGHVCASALVFGLLVSGCSGQISSIGDDPNEAHGTAGAAGSGGSAGTGGTAGGGGAAGSSGVASWVDSIDLSGSPQFYRFVRLTNAQWARSVQDLLALPAPSGLEQNFQSAVSGETAFTNNELALKVNQRSWSDFQTAAEALAQQLTASAGTLSRIYNGTDPAEFIATVGRRAYRRPLTAAEKTAYLTLFNSGSAQAGTGTAFANGAALVIQTMLQSPYFLYRAELGAKDAPLSGYEIAAKLSLWLRGTTPNDALLDDAAAAKLDTADGAAATASVMLGEPAAATVMRQFHGELLHFDRYQTISKLGVSSYKESLNDEYEETSYLFFANVLSKGLGVRDILTSTSGFVGPGTAALYGVAAPANGYAERDLGPQRVGYFSQLPFLTLYGLNGDSDLIHRGVSINLDILCAPLGPPAANIPPVPPLQPGQTNRQRIATLTGGCGGTCHNQQINPIGFSFEHFDGMGQYRDQENGGLMIDSSASYAFSEGTKTYNNAGELMHILADGQQVHACYAKKLAGFALQRDIVESDVPLLTKLADTSRSPSGSVKEVILALVKHDAFRTRAGGVQ